MTPNIDLPPRLDTAAANALIDTLEKHAGDDLTLAGSAVEMIGGLCLEALLVARTIWARDGLRLSISDPSGALLGALALFGALDAGLLDGGDI